MNEKLNNFYSEIFEKELIKEIAENGILRLIPKGELLIDIGDELTHTPLVLDGTIKVMIEDNNGDDIFLYYLKNGETCAISFVNCIHRRVSIFKGIAERDTEGIFIPIEKLDEWLVKYPTWRHFIIDSYHFRLLGMVESIKNMAFLNLGERLLKYLTDKVNVMQTNILLITHEEIADDFNTARSIISRLLKELENEGKIKLRRGRIIIKKI